MKGKYIIRVIPILLIKAVGEHALLLAFHHHSARSMQSSAHLPRSLLSPSLLFLMVELWKRNTCDIYNVQCYEVTNSCVHTLSQANSQAPQAVTTLALDTAVAHRHWKHIPAPPASFTFSLPCTWPFTVTLSITCVPTGLGLCYHTENAGTFQCWYWNSSCPNNCMCATCSSDLHVHVPWACP